MRGAGRGRCSWQREAPGIPGPWISNPIDIDIDIATARARSWPWPWTPGAVAQTPGRGQRFRAHVIDAIRGVHGRRQGARTRTNARAMAVVRVRVARIALQYRDEFEHVCAKVSQLARSAIDNHRPSSGEPATTRNSATSRALARHGAHQQPPHHSMALFLFFLRSVSRDEHSVRLHSSAFHSFASLRLPSRQDRPPLVSPNGGTYLATPPHTVAIRALAKTCAGDKELALVRIAPNIHS
jgi:hypothetical protein